MWLRAPAFLPWPSRATGAWGAHSQQVLAIISASWEILLQLKLLTGRWEKFFYSHLKAALLKPSPAWLIELSIQSRETSRVCAFAILHPGAFGSGLNRR